MKATRNGGGSGGGTGLVQTAKVLAVDVPGIKPDRSGSITSVHDDGRINVSFYPLPGAREADFVRDLAPNQVRLRPEA